MTGERDRNGEGKKQECQVVLYGYSLSAMQERVGV